MINSSCLIQELKRLRESSKEAIEGLGDYSEFKKYMHVKRDVEHDFVEILDRASKSDMPQMIMVCGSVGDGKSHVIATARKDHADIMKDFNIHNDATESDDPRKDFKQVLAEKLYSFSDERLGRIENNEKWIVAINLGTLNNFLDDERYKDKFTKLSKFVLDYRIQEIAYKRSQYIEDSHFQFVNFSDYNMFDLNDRGVYSKFIEEIFEKIVNETEGNCFSKSHRANCTTCSAGHNCPIKYNFEYFKKPEIRDSIEKILIKIMIKEKVILSARSLLNLVYDLIVPVEISQVPVKKLRPEITKVKDSNIIDMLLPNAMFEHKDLSPIYEAFHKNDPVKFKGYEKDEIIMKCNVATSYTDLFEKYVSMDTSDFIRRFMLQKDLNEKQIIKTLIRYVYLESDILDHVDYAYRGYLRYLNEYNTNGVTYEFQDKLRNAIFNWQGVSKEDQINIKLGYNQDKYIMSQDLEIEFKDPKIREEYENRKNICPFIRTAYEVESNKEDQDFELEVDYNLYELIEKMHHGYIPNSWDRSNFVAFSNVIDKMSNNGKQDRKVTINMIDDQKNKTFKLSKKDGGRFVFK